MITYKRGKGTTNSDVKVVQMYKYYLKHRDSKKEITQKIFSSVLEDYNEHKTNQTVYKNIEFQMPFLGRLEIIKLKPKIRFVEDKRNILGYTINYKKTKELWEKNEDARLAKKLVYHLNDETDGYIMRWHWIKGGRIKNISSYKFKPLRKIKRKISLALKTTNYKIDFYIDKYGEQCQRLMGT